MDNAENNGRVEINQKKSTRVTVRVKVTPSHNQSQARLMLFFITNFELDNFDRTKMNHFRKLMAYLWGGV